MDGTGRLSRAARWGLNVRPKMKEWWWACAVEVNISARVDDNEEEEEEEEEEEDDDNDEGGSRYAMKTFESIRSNVWIVVVVPMLSRRVTGGREDLRTWDVSLVLC